MIELLSLKLAESVQTEVEGGLFDFNATLPLMALQFLVLMILLDNIFYKPVSKVLDDRDEYIRNSLTTASASLNKANELTLQYEQELAHARKDAQELIRKSQKDAQEVVLVKIKTAQKDAEILIAEASQQLVLQKEQAIKTLESQVEALSNKIKVKLLNS
uniref:ATP synthase subunit b', chloroplastic n=1 Tax=Helminthora furcellata TaxID=1884666 RepID=A0A1G4NZQ2_9FLOR|nr:ATP synthase CF0 subunit II [Helminthora furcellata]SCW21136.1 ATP synthase CF0 subunit II [Helminthora furcellata]SCW23996.1 ATP synthase CF0 subunit II [Helminthora furcellata]